MNKNTKPDIWFDGSGTLREDLFYRVSIWNAYYPVTIPPFWRSRMILLESARGPKEEALTVSVYSYKETDEAAFRCPNGGQHAMQYALTAVEGERYARGHRLLEFVKDEGMDLLLVSKTFGERIQRSNLKGWRLEPVTVYDHFTRDVIDDTLHLQCTGRNCARPMRVTRDRNTCPFCGKHWIICEKCGHEQRECLESGAMTICDSREANCGSEVRLLTYEVWDLQEEILEGCRWDGADFVRTHTAEYISHRVLRWLQSLHAGPLGAVPARFCTDRMSREQSRWMEEAADWTTVKERAGPR